jgi:pimeloyl-ACP methyl ester carboxylesterase
VAERERLRSAPTAASVLRLPVPDWTKAAVLVAARRDGFVPTRAVEALHHHWPGSELRWRSGGHATLLWRQRHALADAVADSFDRLAADQNA